MDAPPLGDSRAADEILALLDEIGRTLDDIRQVALTLKETDD